MNHSNYICSSAISHKDTLCGCCPRSNRYRCTKILTSARPDLSPAFGFAPTSPSLISKCIPSVCTIISSKFLRHTVHYSAHSYRCWSILISRQLRWDEKCSALQHLKILSCSNQRSRRTIFVAICLLTNKYLFSFVRDFCLQINFPT